MVSMPRNVNAGSFLFVLKTSSDSAMKIQYYVALALTIVVCINLPHY